MISAEELLEQVSEEDVVDILLDLGSDEPKRDGQGNYIFNTVCHHGSGKRKLYYYKNSGMFMCYTSCGSMSLYDLIMSATNCEFIDALRYVAEFKGINLYRRSKGLRFSARNEDLDFLNIHTYKPKGTKEIILPSYDEKVLNMFDHYYPEEWYNEGIKEEVARAYGIRFYFAQMKAIIPHYDFKNRLVGIRGRSFLKEDLDAGRKYMPVTIQGLTYKHPTAYNLYGFNRNHENIKRFKSVILFEAEKSVMLYESYYGAENNVSVATLGMNVSNYQRDLLLSCGINEVTIAFDKQYTNEIVEKADKRSKEYREYVRYIKNLIKITKMFEAYCNVYVILSWGDELSYRDAPIDRGKETFEQLYRNRYLTNSEELEELIND